MADIIAERKTQKIVEEKRKNLNEKNTKIELLKKKRELEKLKVQKEKEENQKKEQLNDYDMLMGFESKPEAKSSLDALIGG